MRRRCFLLTVLLVLAFAAGVRAEIPVGTDIEAEDITDFYYTVSTSTATPFFLRYRFCAEDGKKTFYHETREGGGWPQTE